jgi:rhodanese-related sulfurtransferase
VSGADKSVIHKIQGALRIELSDFSGGNPPALGLIDRSSVVVVYCGGGACDASKNLVITLQNFGFSRFHIMTDGFPAWQQAGHPVAKGPSPIDPEEAM